MKIADLKYTDPRPVESQKFNDAKLHLEANQFENSAWTDQTPCGPLPHIAFKIPSLKATEKCETFEHEVPILQASAQFSHSSVSNSQWPCGLQHARPPCPSPFPGVYLNSRPLNRWCHPTISSSVAPFSSHLQSVPASGSFSTSQFFVSGGQKVLELQLQHQSFQWIFRTDFLQDSSCLVPCNKHCTFIFTIQCQ